jgi:hypothetical protein
MPPASAGQFGDHFDDVDDAFVVVVAVDDGGFVVAGVDALVVVVCGGE